MSVHLTAEELESYGSGGLEAKDLVRLNEHLAICDECRREIPFDIRRLDSLSVLKEEDTGEDHLSYEMIEAYAQSLIDDVDREIVTTHAESCSECADRIESLQQFAAMLAAPPVRRNAAASPAATPQLTVWQRISAAVKAPKWSYAIIGAAAVLVVSIMIQQHSVRIGSGSQSSMLPASPVSIRPIIESAANAPGSEIPALLRQVADRNSAGSGSLSPGGVVLRTTNPLFKWESVSGADSYRVEVLDGADFVRSGVVSETQWSPDTGLTRGRVYTWTVTADVSGKPVTIPNTLTGSPVKATFGIISTADERRLSEALARFPDSHLLLAATYLDLGLLDDAESELSKIDSRTDSNAMKLRTRIDGIRQAMQ